MTSQSIMSAGQLANTAITLQSQGNLMSAEGVHAMLSDARSQGIGMATAPLFGAMTAGIGGVWGRVPGAATRVGGIEIPTEVPADAASEDMSIDHDFEGGLDQFPDGAPPRIVDPDLAANVHQLTNTEYNVTYSGLDRIPLVTSQHLTREQLEDIVGSVRRSNDFRPDLRLPAEARAELATTGAAASIAVT